MSPLPPLLKIEGLQVVYNKGTRREFQALDGVDLEIAAGETIGVVGESGSGKTTIGRAVLGQVTPSAGRIVFEGRDITHARGRARRALGRDIQVVFQDPYSSLNPVRTIGQTLIEPLLVDRSLSPREARQRVREVLDAVSMPADTIERYPTQFSGGQRQRIAIARAVVCRPKLIICDEPVSALDLSVQAQVLNLLNELQREMGLSLLFISHDLTVVRHVSQRTLVLLRGEVVEEGETAALHESPQHPYTRALLAAVPVPDPLTQRRRLRTPMPAADAEQLSASR